MAECITCEEEYSDKRLELGYETCLECGQEEATSVIRARNRRTLAKIAPAAAAAGEFDGIEKRDDWADEKNNIEEKEDESR
jgi:hypothetical protein